LPIELIFLGEADWGGSDPAPSFLAGVKQEAAAVTRGGLALSVAMDEPV
jgi:hypothetical protein